MRSAAIALALLLAPAPASALDVSWDPVYVTCTGDDLLFPENVTYALPYRVRAMVLGPPCPQACAIDPEGNPIDPCVDQECAVYLWTDEWATGTDTFFEVTGPLAEDPPVGVVFDVQEPVAMLTDLWGNIRRSDECQ